MSRLTCNNQRIETIDMYGALSLVWVGLCFFVTIIIEEYIPFVYCDDSMSMELSQKCKIDIPDTVLLYVGIP